MKFRYVVRNLRARCGGGIVSYWIGFMVFVIPLNIMLYQPHQSVIPAILQGIFIGIVSGFAAHFLEFLP